ncbi:MAG: ABC transporter ATP-binding protein [Proteobacteria bacterium]|nr:MAG: ABC transporter ATP-binding protein [Pseudomonadota bacterium]PIE17972.1 MAG: ABC transporter ATP-binding protein [Pseudomonadota bacterium]
MTRALIELRGVHKAFNGHPVLRGIDLRVEEGEVLFIIGTSGVGKSVTIKHVIGLLAPDEGEILVDGVDVTKLRERQTYGLRRKVQMVFQHATLFDSLSVVENVMLPLSKHRRLRRAAARDEAMEKLALVGMESFAERMPAELGNGLRKRVAIARALTLDPEVLLFDEPTTGLDPISARRVDALITQLKGCGVTQVVVSHDLQSIFGVADRIAFVYQGKIYREGAPAELRESADPIVRQFLRGESEGPLETPGF